MFTDRIERDILLNHDIISFHRKLFFQMFGRVLVKSAVDLPSHTGDTVLSLQKPLPVHILADSLQQKLNAGLNLLIIHHKKTHLLRVTEHMTKYPFTI